LGIVGVSVEYRLAPETPYPGPLDDCHAALRWTHQHADELGIDPARIGAYGLSAGGGLAAALALLARDRDLPLAFQLLDCPMLDDRQATPSIRAECLYVWNAQSNEFGWRSYLGDLYGSDDIPPYAAAARATDLTGLPPSCVVVGSIDGFRDEDVDYAQRLNQAGVPCELHVLAGLPHAYQMAPAAPVVQLATHCMDDWLVRQLARLSA
jgi:acetyl esterase/lipase